MVYKRAVESRLEPRSAGRAAPGVAALLRITLATLSVYLIGYPFSAAFVVTAALAVLLGLGGAARAVTVLWGRFIFWIVGRNLVVRGAATIEQARPCIVVANHASMFDIPALMAAIPGIVIIGRDWLWRIPVLGFLLTRLRFVPIDTSSPRESLRAIEQAVRAASEGLTIGIFPEGTRTRTGQLQDLKRGFIRVMRESGRDLLPVAVHGTFALKPKGRLTVDPRERIRVEVKPPLAHEELAPLPDRQILQIVRAALQHAQGDLSEQA